MTQSSWRIFPVTKLCIFKEDRLVKRFSIQLSKTFWIRWLDLLTGHIDFEPSGFFEREKLQSIKNVEFCSAFEVEWKSSRRVFVVPPILCLLWHLEELRSPLRYSLFQEAFALKCSFRIFFSKRLHFVEAQPRWSSSPRVLQSATRPGLLQHIKFLVLHIIDASWF
jgi:hypothetical protein